VAKTHSKAGAVASEAIHNFVEETLDAWKVPGAAVALIKDDTVVLCEGFGKRDREAGLPVTADTLFPIASVTKSFTALSIGLLVDEGRLAWDTPVREFLPSFRLNDPVASERVTPRDLLCHRTGLPRHDMTWFASDFDRPQLMARLHHLTLSRDLRTAFQYNNLMFMAAGYLVGEIAGASWETFVRQRLFAPLGMSRSNNSTVTTAADPDHATGYVDIEDVIQPRPYHEQDAERHGVGPAGNICSSARDLARYVRMHLAGGRLDGTQIVSEATVAETHQPQMIMPPLGRMDAEMGVSMPSYGLGWMINAWQGRRLVQHGGGMPGISTLITLLPDAGIGAVVLTNVSGVPVPTILALSLMERLLGTEPLIDYSGIIRPFFDEGKAGIKTGKEKSEEDRLPDAPPSRPLIAYCGDYEHPGYGVATVELADATGAEKGGLRLVLNDKLAFALAPYHYDVFEAHHEPLDIRYKATFAGDAQGRLASLSLPLEGTVPDIVFTHLPDRALRDTSRWRDYAGTYDLLGRPVAVTYRADGSLAVTFAGDMIRALTPYRSHGETLEFAVEGRVGVRLAFPRDVKGAATEVVITAGGAVYTGRRASA
jgi:CubicO group peptidase (beta-lactamase class C family)